jgi:hypothetical protein
LWFCLSLHLLNNMFSLRNMCNQLGGPMCMNR